MNFSFPEKLKRRLADRKAYLKKCARCNNYIEKVAGTAAVYELEWVQKELER